MTTVVRPDEIGDVVRWLQSEIGVPFVVVGDRPSESRFQSPPRMLTS